MSYPLHSATRRKNPTNRLSPNKKLDTHRHWCIKAASSTHGNSPKGNGQTRIPGKTNRCRIMPSNRARYVLDYRLCLRVYIDISKLCITNETAEWSCYSVHAGGLIRTRSENHRSWEDISVYCEAIYTLGAARMGYATPGMRNHLSFAAAPGNDRLYVATVIMAGLVLLVVAGTTAWIVWIKYRVKR